jgi:putative transcriptional regulator
MLRLRSNLSLLMGKHRCKIQEVHERTGLARRTISTLYYDKAARIDFSTVEKLCEMFNCDVGELFTLVETPQTESNESTERRPR